MWCPGQIFPDNEADNLDWEADNNSEGFYEAEKEFDKLLNQIMNEGEN